MAQKIDSLYVEIDAKLDGLNQGLNKTEGRFKKFKGGLGVLKTGVLALGAAGITAGAGLLKIGDEFDKAMRKIAVGTGATGENLKTLKADFEAVFQDVPDDAGVVADAIATLNTATGATGEVLQGLTESVLDVSRILGEDASTNAEKFGQVLNQFSVPAENGRALLDNLFRITQDYGVSLTDLNGQLTKYGAVMKNAGFSVEQTALLMGKMNKAGLSWSRVSPGLNKAFRDMAKNGVNARDGLALAVKKIKETEDSTKALALATEIFGAEGAQRMLTAIKDNVFTLDDFEKVLGNNTGLIEKTEQQTRTLGEEFDELKNELMLLLEPLARDLVAALKNAIPLIKDMFTHIGTAIDWIKDFGKAIYDVALNVSIKVGEMVGSARELYNGIKTWMVDKFLGVVNSVKQSIEDIKGFFWDMYDDVVGHSSVPDTVKRIGEEMGPNLRREMVDNAETNIEDTKKAFDGFFIDINGMASGAWDELGRGFGDSTAAWVVDGESFGESMGEVFKNMARNFVSMVAEMVFQWATFQAAASAGITVPVNTVPAGGGVGAGAGGAAGLGVGIAAGAGGVGGYYLGQELGGSGTGGAIGGSIGAGLGMTFGGPLGAAVGGYAGAVAGTALESAPSQAKKLPGQIKDFADDIWPFADGGIVTKPTLGLIGEAGEAEAVIPLSRLENMMNKGEQQTIIVELDGQQIANTTVRHMPGVLRVHGVPF